MKQMRPIWALGMMSGTSLDGVDAAMILTDGVQIFEFGPHDYRPYTASEQAVLRADMGKWHADAPKSAEIVESAHVDLASRFSGADVIGFHGQTLAHDPAHGRTHQVGDGALIARALRRTVVWDFRSCDVALGGQGAPLVPYFHHACARFAGLTAPVAILNLGGVGNVTWVDPRAKDPCEVGAVLAFDTGPANAPINDLMLARRGLLRDDNGALARQGTVDAALVARVMAHSYFARLPPKSLDRNAFSEDLARLDALSDADSVATATAIAAAAVELGMQHFPAPAAQMLVAGGGRHNGALMDMIADRINSPVHPIESIGLNGDMLEAQAFGFLALRVMRGLPTSGPSTTGVTAHVSGGMIARED
jgi:anhydro-N-acetylmuramic acid kinase